MTAGIQLSSSAPTPPANATDSEINRWKRISNFAIAVLAVGAISLGIGLASHVVPLAIAGAVVAGIALAVYAIAQRILIQKTAELQVYHLSHRLQDLKADLINKIKNGTPCTTEALEKEIKTKLKNYPIATDESAIKTLAEAVANAIKSKTDISNPDDELAVIFPDGTVEASTEISSKLPTCSDSDLVPPSESYDLESPKSAPKTSSTEEAIKKVIDAKIKIDEFFDPQIAKAKAKAKAADLQAAARVTSEAIEGATRQAAAAAAAAATAEATAEAAAEAEAATATAAAKIVTKKGTVHSAPSERAFNPATSHHGCLFPNEAGDQKDPFKKEAIDRQLDGTLVIGDKTFDLKNFYDLKNNQKEFTQFYNQILTALNGDQGKLLKVLALFVPRQFQSATDGPTRLYLGAAAEMDLSSRAAQQRKEKVTVNDDGTFTVEVDCKYSYGPVRGSSVTHRGFDLTFKYKGTVSIGRQTKKGGIPTKYTELYQAETVTTTLTPPAAR